LVGMVNAQDMYAEAEHRDGLVSRHVMNIRITELPSVDNHDVTLADHRQGITRIQDYSRIFLQSHTQQKWIMGYSRHEAAKEPVLGKMLIKDQAVCESQARRKGNAALIRLHFLASVTHHVLGYNGGAG